MIIKKIILILLFVPHFVYALEYPKVNSKIVEIFDLTDEQILYENKVYDVVSIASLTKIATVMVAIENIKNLDVKVTITKDILKTVSDEAHVAGLKKGDQVTYRDLLYATMVASGADAANALAIFSSGSINNHVKKMNDLVKKLGLEHTHFANVTGLDDKGNYSSADDVRKLLIYALNNTLFKDIYFAKNYQLSSGLKVNTTLKLYDNNGIVDTSFIKGSKTGFTDNAGYCLAYLVDINGHNILFITLKAERNGNNYYSLIDANTLVNFMKNNYHDEILIEENQTIREIPVNMSDIEKYSILSYNTIKKYLPSDYDKTKFKIEYNGLEELSYKNHVGEKIGTISYYFDDELLTTQDVVLNEKININFGKLIKKYCWLMVSILLFLIIFIRKLVNIKKLKTV